MIRNDSSASLLLLFFTLLASVANAQVKTLFPAINVNNLVKGDSIKIVVKNTGPKSVTFYPLSVFDKDTSRIFLSQEKFIAYIQLAGDQIAQIERLAYILKSNSFYNNYFVFEDTTTTRYKRYSGPMFCLGASEEQCGEYNAFATEILIETGAFARDSVFHISLDGHQPAGCVINGDSILLDFDPGEPLFLAKLPNGKYYSASNIVLYPQYLYPQLYNYCDPVSGSCYPLMVTKSPLYSNGLDSAEQANNAISRYVAFFDSGITYWPAETIIIQHDTGAWTLPAGGSITISFSVTADITPNQLDTVVDLYFNGQDSAAFDSIASYLHESDSLATQALMQNNVLLDTTETANDLILSNVYEKQMFIGLDVVTDSLADTIGKDLRMPCWLHDITLSPDSINNPVAVTFNDSLSDTTFTTGTSVMTLWNMKGQIDSDGFSPTDDTTVPNPTVNQIQKVQHGSISSHTRMHAGLYYNQLIYRFLNGMTVDFLGMGGDSSLTVSIDTPISTTTPTSISKPTQDELFKVYPNPANAYAVLESHGLIGHSAHVLDARGSQIFSFVITNNRQRLELSTLAKGAYFVAVGNSVKKVIKQ